MVDRRQSDHQRHRLDDTARAVLGRVNKKFGTPDYAFVLMGVIATAITILAYVLDPNRASVFSTLFALSSSSSGSRTC